MFRIEKKNSADRLSTAKKSDQKSFKTRWRRENVKVQGTSKGQVV